MGSVTAASCHGGIFVILGATRRISMKCDVVGTNKISADNLILRRISQL